MPPKRKCLNSSAPRSKFKKARTNKHENIRSVKCGLKSALRRDFTSESKQEILRTISEKSIKHTWLWQLASLQFLCRVNENFDRRNWDYFDKDGAQATTEIQNCFKSVLFAHVTNESYEMPAHFRLLCQQYNCEFPDLWMDNAFKYACSTYERNCTTNLTYHEENRIGKFLRVIIDRYKRTYNLDYTQKDIDNTMKHVFDREPLTGATAQEMQHFSKLTRILVRFGAPPDLNIHEFTKNSWFKSLPMWLRIQRVIEDENLHRSQSQESTKKMSNFSVVPLCNFTRKFVEIDSCDLREMMNKWSILPKDYRKSVRGRLIKEAEFNKQKEWHWSIVFDMEKILKLSRHEFRYCRMACHCVCSTRNLRVRHRRMKQW